MTRQTFKANFLSVLVLLPFFIFYRPTQDDYNALSNLTTGGFWSLPRAYWNGAGGNLSEPVLLNLGVLGNNGFWLWVSGLVVLGGTTWLIRFSSVILFSWLFPTVELNDRAKSWIRLGSIVSFAGIFVPGMFLSFGFIGSATTHLWPVCFFIIGLWSLQRKETRIPVTIIVGFLAGNFNLTEGLFGLVVVLIFLSSSKMRKLIGNIKTARLWIFLVSIFSGVILIVAAPGLQNRLKDSQNQSEDSSLIIKFAKAFIYDFGDFFTHPIWILGLVLGVYLAWMYPEILKSISPDFVKALVLAQLGIIALTIVGSTFAYPAWHQTTGFYVFSLPLAIGIGILLSEKLKFLTESIVISILVAASLIIALLVVRDATNAVQRGLQWDKNLITNCQIIFGQNPEAQLVGAEVIYPPLGLGIEDVNTWPWMRDSYVTWIKGGGVCNK